MMVTCIVCRLCVLRRLQATIAAVLQGEVLFTAAVA